MTEKTSNNPDIAEHGKDTRFGQPGAPDPAKCGPIAAKAKAANYSARAELTYLMAHDFGGVDTPEELNAALKRVKKKADGTTTGARLLAVRILERGLKKGDPATVFGIMENVEGKLSQEIILPSKSPAPTEATTLEEAERLYKEHMPK